MILPSSLNGSLRVYGNELERLQRFLDPPLAALLFYLIVCKDSQNPIVSTAWLWILIITGIIMPRPGIYGSYRQISLLFLTRRLSGRWLSVVTLALILAFITKTSALFSRQEVIEWGLCTWVAILASHVGLRQVLRWYRISGGNIKTILFWGSTNSALSFQKELENAPWMGLRIVAWFSPDVVYPDQQPPELPACGGGLAELRRWVDANSVDRIIFSHVNKDKLTMESVLQMFGNLCIPVSYAPDWALASMNLRTSLIGRTNCIDIWGIEQGIVDQQVKRIFDVVLTIIGLVFIAPLLLAIAVAVVVTSPGPILFSQMRYGLDGTPFRIYKFRTMSVMEEGDTPGLQQATKNDARVTPVGRFLRRWSLDELPQLINVLRGEMSLVGPRPHAIEHNEQYRQLIPGYMQRHAAKPGMTGLAQVEGWRGETSDLESMSRRIDADLRYQRNWSLRLDIKILTKTIIKIRSKKAY